MRSDADRRSTTPPRRRSPLRRRALVLVVIGRRMHRRSSRRLVLLSGWVWIAAISLVGVEMFDVVFGTFLLAPELLPVVLIGLACAWYFRAALRRAERALRVRLRLLRARRRR